MNPSFPTFTPLGTQLSSCDVDNARLLHCNHAHQVSPLASFLAVDSQPHNHIQRSRPACRSCPTRIAAGNRTLEHHSSRLCMPALDAATGSPSSTRRSRCFYAPHEPCWPKRALVRHAFSRLGGQVTWRRSRFVRRLARTIVHRDAKNLCRQLLVASVPPEKGRDGSLLKKDDWCTPLRDRERDIASA